MKLITEVASEQISALIIGNNFQLVVNLLKKYLKKIGVNVFYSSKIPGHLKNFNYLFFLNPNLTEIEKILTAETAFKKIVLFFFKNSTLAKNSAVTFKKNKKIKIIDCNNQYITERDLDNLLWFSFSESEQNYLRLQVIQPIKIVEKKKKGEFLSFFLKKITFKKISFLIFILIFILHFLYLPLLLTSILINYQIFNEAKRENLSQIKNLNQINKKIIKSSYYLYQIVKPTYLFLSINILPDNIFDILNSLSQIYEDGYDSFINTKAIIPLFLKTQKSENERKEILTRIDILKNKIDLIDRNFNIVSYKIANFLNKDGKNKIVKIKEIINIIKSLLKYEKELLAASTEQKYLLLFANNRELRPGGGFIGSFGILKINDYSIKEIQIYDVYDADGQLKIHVEPPMPIKKYLNQPHWYLRDSNFSPDFYENYQKAKFFLKEEINLEDFAGSLLITTSAVEELLKPFDNLYLPDYKENVNSDNFFIKAQMYTEKNFFPGSIQKKSFLSSVLRQVLVNFNNVSPIKLLLAIKKSFEEKQMVIFFENKNLQKITDNLFYSGRIIKPKCPQDLQNCLNDYLFFYDTNLGVNKADYYISKQIIYNLKIDKTGKINQNLTLEYLNNSPSLVFPGGIYRNYFQILLPKKVKISQITKDGVLIEDFDIYVIDNFFQKVGFYFEINPKKKTIIKINYQFEESLKIDKQVYQLIIQKQIGAKNNDFVLNINLPTNISLINQNFIPLVKDSNIVYNTILDSDKIFFMEFNLK